MNTYKKDLELLVKGNMLRPRHTGVQAEGVKERGELERTQCLSNSIKRKPDVKRMMADSKNYEDVRRNEECGLLFSLESLKLKICLSLHAF